MQPCNRSKHLTYETGKSRGRSVTATSPDRQPRGAFRPGVWSLDRWQRLPANHERREPFVAKHEPECVRDVDAERSKCNTAAQRPRALPGTVGISDRAIAHSTRRACRTPGAADL